MNERDDMWQEGRQKSHAERAESSSRAVLRSLSSSTTSTDDETDDEPKGAVRGTPSVLS